MIWEEVAGEEVSSPLPDLNKVLLIWEQVAEEEANSPLLDLNKVLVFCIEMNQKTTVVDVEVNNRILVISCVEIVVEANNLNPVVLALNKKVGSNKLVRYKWAFGQSSIAFSFLRLKYIAKTSVAWMVRTDDKVQWD